MSSADQASKCFQPKEAATSVESERDPSGSCSTPFHAEVPLVKRRRLYDLDAAILNCPWCKEPLYPPVYQCKNGHIFCGSCWAQFLSDDEDVVNGTCRKCSESVHKLIRCEAVEEILEALQVSCKHAHHGCTEMLKYTEDIEREEHEKQLCKYLHIRCLVKPCTHESTIASLPLHMSEKHNVPTVEVRVAARGNVASFTMKNRDDNVMVKDVDGEMFLVHRLFDSSDIGDEFFCRSFGASNKAFKLKVKLSGRTEMDSYTMTRTTVKDLRWEEQWERDFLFFPWESDIYDENDEVERQLDVTLSFSIDLN